MEEFGIGEITEIINDWDWIHNGNGDQEEEIYE